MADAIDAMFSADDTPVLAFQRVTGNAHELDELRALLAKIQARLSATEDDDELDALVAERKAVKAGIEAFTVVPDSYDYAPTGQTVAGMWDGGDTVKRDMVKAVKGSWGLALAEHAGQWRVKLGTDPKDTGDADGIVDLGNGLCFRRQAGGSGRGSPGNISGWASCLLCIRLWVTCLVVCLIGCVRAFTCRRGRGA